MRESPFGRLAHHVLERTPTSETARIDVAEWCEIWGITPAQFLREVATAEHHGQATIVAIEVRR